MKILAIIGSGRKQGNTSKIASLLFKRVKSIGNTEENNIELEKLFLSDYNLNHCLGCRNCMDRGEDKCPLKDDLSIIKAKIDESDAVIFGSPVYVGSVSSMMKALIDRLAYICHRQEFYEKVALTYSTSGGSTTKQTNRVTAGALLCWGFNILGTAGFVTKCFDTEGELEEKYGKKLDKLARKLFENVRNKSYLRPSALSLAMFKLQQKYRANPELATPIDYSYWKEKGWADANKNYYIQHKSGKVKIVLSKIIYNVINLLFIS